MKNFVRVLLVAAALVSTAQAQYYPYYNSYQRHSVPANNYARGYNQGMANAYIGMNQGSNLFMNGFAAGAQMAQPPVVVMPPPVYAPAPVYAAPVPTYNAPVYSVPPGYVVR